MNCELCFRPLRRNKFFNIYEKHFDNNYYLVGIIEQYLRIKVCVCACKIQKRTKECCDDLLTN